MKFLNFSRILKLKLLYPGIEIDFNSVIESDCNIICVVGGRLKIENSSIRRGSTIFCDENAEILFDNCIIGEFNNIVAKSKIEIGFKTLIGEFVTIRDQDHRYEAGKNIGDSGFESAPILIKNNVWIANKVTILKGVVLESGTIIGANAVVNQSTEMNSIYAGIPAKLIKKY